MPISLDDRFHERMLALYWDMGRAIGYWAHRYLHKVRRVGGVQAAKDWLDANKGTTTGFERLAEADRLDLTVEALVLEQPWRQLFSETELAVAQQRLDHARSTFSKETHRKPEGQEGA